MHEKVPQSNPPSRQKQMQILHVIRSLRRESGGPLEGLLRLSDFLISEGHKLEIVALDNQEEVARLAASFPVTALGCGIGRYGYNPRLDRWMKANSSRFDVVILHGLWNYSSVGSWRVLRKSQTPYVVFVHGMMSPWFRDTFPMKHLVKQAFWSLLEGRVVRDARYALFTTEEEKLRARNVFLGYQYYKERVVPYGTVGPVGDEASQRMAALAAHPVLEDRRFFLFVGRLHEVKGCDLLIQAFAQSLDRVPRDVDIVIAGPDQTGLSRRLKTMAQRLGIEERVHWTGMVNGEVKWGLLRSCEALILPSHHENFGMVVAEAMACSRPVLISNKVAIWREVAGSSAGIVESDTLEGTRQLIVKFWDLSENERSRMGLAAMRAFRYHFDIEVTAHIFVRAVGFEREDISDRAAVEPIR